MPIAVDIFGRLNFTRLVTPIWFQYEAEKFLHLHWQRLLR